MPGHLSELIFKKVATEIEHILRLSKLKEYASHSQYSSYGSSQESKVRKYYEREKRGFPLELDVTLTPEWNETWPVIRLSKCDTW